MNELFDRAMFLEMSNYSGDYTDCVRQAVKEIVPDYELKEIYSLFDIDKEQYIKDLSNSYLRYKRDLIIR